MSKSKRAPTPKPVDVLDWAGARTQRAEYGPAAVIFAQGDPATSSTNIPAVPQRTLRRCHTINGEMR